MTIELTSQQQQILERAVKAGLRPEEVLDRAFAVIQDQLETEDWMLAEREMIAAHIAEGCAQAKRGELYTPEEALRILRERRAKRQVA